MTATLPKQDLSLLARLPSTDPYQENLLLANMNQRLEYTIQRFRKNADNWNADIAARGPERRVASFALLCYRIMTNAWDSDSEDRLCSFVFRGGVRRLLNMPAIAGLHEDPRHADAIRSFLWRGLMWWRSGNWLGFPGEGQWEFVEELYKELTRRRRAAKRRARLQQRRTTA